MKIIIKETQELKELKFIDRKSGCEYTNDLVGNHQELNYNEEIDRYEFTQDDFDFWEKYLSDHEKIEEMVFEFSEKHNLKFDDVMFIVTDEMNCELETELFIVENFFTNNSDDEIIQLVNNIN